MGRCWASRDLHARGWAFIVVGVLACIASFAVADDLVPEKKPATDAQIAKLVEQLGSDQFATREKAQSELERLGLLAFDVLQEAQHNDDIEIALRARYLLRVMPISWSREGDTAEIRNILKNYGEQNEQERHSRMDRLAGLAGLPSTVALCRLARFETSNLLSKRAALLAMNATAPDSPEARATLVATIQGVVGSSKRTSARWLNAYSQTLTNAEASLEEWQKLTKAEADVFRQSPDQTTGEMLRDLLRWNADLSRRLKHDEAALALVRRTIGLVEGDEDELAETVDWLLERKYWPLVTEVAQRFKEEFADSALLTYRLAESQRLQGDEKGALAAAEQAFKIEMDVAEKNISSGMDLEDRGMFDWAERELRHAMKIASMETAEHVRARFRLSEMFHDMGKDLDAAVVLQELVDAMQKDPNLEQRIEGTSIRDPNAFRARMHYFFAQHYLEKSDIKEHRVHLEQALAADPKDADVLIAMFRVPNASEEWQARTKKMIWEGARGFHDDVDKFERVVNEQPDERQRGEVGSWLAMLCNQYAWLVGNTEGDYEEARRCSHKSLELRPGEAGYMDTLARCYFAKKDYENAVKYQAMAAKKKPHSGQILRQLKFFEKSLADSRQNSPSAEPPK